MGHRPEPPEDDEMLDLRPFSFEEVLRGILAADPAKMTEAEEPDQATERTDRAS